MSYNEELQSNNDALRDILDDVNALPDWALASRLSLGVHVDGLLYVFVDGNPAGTGIELPKGGISGHVDSENNIVINGLPDGSYTVKYEMADGSTINIGDLVLDSRRYYSVTNVLTNCVNSATVTEIVSGESYEATITPISGYELKSVSVTMGGSPVTVSGGTISIASVTGNIVITAVAEETAVTPSYKNWLPLSVDADGNDYVGDNGEDGYRAGYKLSNSSATGESSVVGAYVSGFIPVSASDEIRIKNITLHSGINVNNIFFYDALKEKVYSATGTEGQFNPGVEIDGDVYYFASSRFTAETNIAFFRFSCGGITEETIVTINEEIV